MTTEELRKTMDRLRVDTCEARPLVGSITNAVTVNFVVNAQLASGGRAAVFYLPDEAEYFARHAKAFYINMGTLLPIHGESIPLAAKTAHEANTPWVLDPVGIGVGALRHEILMRLKEYAPAVIRCNASEAIALADLWGVLRGEYSVSGVDSTVGTSEAHNAAVGLARFTGGAVAVSGVSDLVTDGEQVAVISEGGSPMMSEVTGTGCALGGVIAVYAAMAAPFVAALMGAVRFREAGRAAERQSEANARQHHLGSFVPAFLDALATRSPNGVDGISFELERSRP